ncbi:hypothetical protein [Brevibacterium samyangense]|uniref:Meckel syndrome type 1 protein n=1 Tax=Brevibacterium samyangense TaxID=366888 RepID=A0ABP5ERB3_9MICO
MAEQQFMTRKERREAERRAREAEQARLNAEVAKIREETPAAPTSPAAPSESAGTAEAPAAGAAPASAQSAPSPTPAASPSAAPAQKSAPEKPADLPHFETRAELRRYLREHGLEPKPVDADEAPAGFVEGRTPPPESVAPSKPGRHTASIPVVTEDQAKGVPAKPAGSPSTGEQRTAPTAGKTAAAKAPAAEAPTTKTPASKPAQATPAQQAPNAEAGPAKSAGKKDPTAKPGEAAATAKPAEAAATAKPVEKKTPAANENQDAKPNQDAKSAVTPQPQKGGAGKPGRAKPASGPAAKQQKGGAQQKPTAPEKPAGKKAADTLAPAKGPSDSGPPTQVQPVVGGGDSVDPTDFTARRQAATSQDDSTGSIPTRVRRAPVVMPPTTGGIHVVTGQTPAVDGSASSGAADDGDGDEVAHPPAPPVPARDVTQQDGDILVGEVPSKVPFLILAAFAAVALVLIVVALFLIF